LNARLKRFINFSEARQLLFQIKVLPVDLQKLVDSQITMDSQITSGDYIEIPSKVCHYPAEMFRKAIHYIFANSQREFDIHMQ
jgi:Ni2+-binding GTPase involved in maturation of urease and hydrogenase